jgi:ABC-type Mn2+/Zn2+ transport system permease subunit
LVIAMLILPGATARLMSNRLGVIMVLTVIHCAIASLVGVHLAYWLNCSMAAAIVVAATALFGIVWLLSPTQGLIRRAFHKLLTTKEPVIEGAKAAA